MAHFAQLDEANVVLQVLKIENSEIIDSNGQEIEQLGISFLKSLYGENTNWIQTSYNSNFRKNYAGPGHTYDANRDAFIPPKTLKDWILDEQTCRWVPPFPMPDDGKFYVWNNEDGNWKEIVIN